MFCATRMIWVGVKNLNVYFKNGRTHEVTGNLYGGTLVLLGGLFFLLFWGDMLYGLISPS